MKILFLSAEATPYVKVGGLGDVAGALPKALRNVGLDVRAFIPRYGQIDPGKWKLTKVLDNYPVPMDWRHEECQLLADPNSETFFVENQYFFGSRGACLRRRRRPRTLRSLLSGRARSLSLP